VAKQAAEDPLVAQAFDADKHDQLARAVEQLTPEEAAFFLDKLERAIKKRKIQVMGYLVAMVVWAAGMVCALAYFGISSGFVGWVFLVPFGLVGGVLWAFGKWADKVGNARVETPPRDNAAPGA
jgi:hypothetical protein